MDNPLDCCICLEKYNDSLKIPRMLKCGHTFCSSCLKEFAKLPLSQREKFIKCPLDKSIGHINTNYEELPINRIILDIIEFNGVINLEKLSLNEKIPIERSNIIENLSDRLNSINCFYVENYEVFSNYLNTTNIYKIQMTQEINQHFDKIQSFLEGKKYDFILKLENFFNEKTRNCKLLLQKLSNNIHLIKEYYKKLEVIHSQKKQKTLSTFDEVKSVNDIGINNLEDSNFLDELKKQSIAIEVETRPTVVYKNQNNIYENLQQLAESINLIFPSDGNLVATNKIANSLDFNLNQMNIQLQNISLENNFFWFQYNSCRILNKNINETEWKQVPNTTSFKFVELFRICLVSPNSALITGGFDHFVTSNKTYLFKEGIFIRKENMLQERRAHSCTKSTRFVYVCGGVNHKNEPISSCEKYDLENDKWTKISNMNYPKSHLSICSYNNEFIFSFGGENKNECLLDIIEKYTINIDIWNTLRVKLQFKIECVACTQFKDFILIIGGYNIEIGPVNMVYSLDLNNLSLNKLKNLEKNGWSIYQPIVLNNEIHILSGGEETNPPTHIIYQMEN